MNMNIIPKKRLIREHILDWYEQWGIAATPILGPPIETRLVTSPLNSHF